MPKRIILMQAVIHHPTHSHQHEQPAGYEGAAGRKVGSAMTISPVRDSGSTYREPPNRTRDSIALCDLDLATWEENEK
jgi:hypothetical protein